MRARAAWMLAASLLAVSAALAAPAPAGASVHCVVRITRFAFQPATVHAGGRTEIGLEAVNCTGRALDLDEVRYGTPVGSCPVMDPVGMPVHLEPHATFDPPPLRFLAPQCDGGEVMTVRFSDANGTVLDSRRATLRIRATAS